MKKSNFTPPAPTGQKEFSDAEIKTRLKARSKSELIKIVINLSARIDELKENTLNKNDLLEWANKQYDMQVKERPNVNVFKETLHNVWKQVINHIKGTENE